MCEDYKEDKAFITQRNRFFQGDELDVLPPSGIPFIVNVIQMFDERGNEVEKAPHAMQKLVMIADKEIPKGSVLRKRR